MLRFQGTLHGPLNRTTVSRQGRLRSHPDIGAFCSLTKYFLPSRSLTPSLHLVETISGSSLPQFAGWRTASNRMMTENSSMPSRNCRLRRGASKRIVSLGYSSSSRQEEKSNSSNVHARAYNVAIELSLTVSNMNSFGRECQRTDISLVSSCNVLRLG